MFSFPEAARALKAELQLPNVTCFATGASIDTRTLQPGDFFVPLSGNLDNGHRFLDEAFRKGASGALVDLKIFEEQKERFYEQRNLFQNLLPVPDTQKTFRQLAEWYRKRFDLLNVGITGSVGKTTTKEFLYYLLRQKFPVVATQGNLNNHLGLPLTLFSIRQDDRMCVAELGANHVGEIRDLAALLQPKAAIITAISPAHLEGFGSLEKIYEAKTELLEALPKEGLAVLNGDDPLLIKKARALGLTPTTVGFNEGVDYRLTQVRQKNGCVEFLLNQDHAFRFPGVAQFLALNAALAVVMAHKLGIAFEDMPHQWDDVRLPRGRFQEHQLPQSVRVIDDCYNASPYSFEKALEVFDRMEVSGRKMLVFADMLELGPEAQKYHEILGYKIAQTSIDTVLAFGYLTRSAIESLKVEDPDKDAHYFQEFERAIAFLRDWLRAGDTILLKGSRGMKVERVLAYLQKEGKDSQSPSVQVP